MATGSRRPGPSTLPDPTMHSDQALRVAVVGAGPAGFYAAGHLLAAERPVRVDLFDRLPTPFGLVRAGVAPDHPKIKSVVRVYEKTAAKEGFRFFGGVELGRDLHRADLLERYHAVIYAIGAAIDRRLGIPGEDLPGSEAATTFVGWYNGHPGLPGPRVRPRRLRAGRRGRQRQRRDRLRADARAERRRAAQDRHGRPRDRPAGLRRGQGDRDPRPPRSGAGGLHQPRAAGARRARAGGRDRRPGGPRAGRGVAGVARLRRVRQDHARERADPARVRGAQARRQAEADRA